MAPSNLSDNPTGLGDSVYYAQWYGSRDPQFYGSVLSEVVHRGRPGNILEIGCGPGLFVELARKWGIEAKGCDGSDAAIELASQRVGGENVQKSLLPEPLPYSDASFDNVLLNQVIEHMPVATVKVAFDECRRVLRPGGMLFIFSPGKGNKTELAKDPTHRSAFFPSELRALLQSTGFVVVHEPNALRLPKLILFLNAIRNWFYRTAFADRLSATANACARRA